MMFKLKNFIKSKRKQLHLNHSTKSKNKKFNQQNPYMQQPPRTETLQGRALEVEDTLAAPVARASEPRYQGRELKVEDALSYLDQVKARFSDQPKVYTMFCLIMKKFKTHTIDTKGVIHQVCELFKDSTDLLVGFNTFMPPGFKIHADGTCTVPDGTIRNGSARQNYRVQGQGQQQGQPVGQVVADPVFDQSIHFLTTVRKRFAADPDTYKSFLEILRTYQKDQKSIEEVLGQVFSLFAGHPDLLQGFTYFLPQREQEKAKEQMNLLNRNQYRPRDPYKGCSADQLLRFELLLRHGGSANAAFQAMAVNKGGGGYISRAGMRCAMRELGLTTNEEWKAVRKAVFGTSAVSTSHEGQMSISLADFERWVNSVRLTILRADGESLHLGTGTDTPILPDVLTVGDLKCLIANRTGVRSADQKLFVDTSTDSNADCELRDCDTLTKSGIAGSCSSIWVLITHEIS